MCGGLFFKCLYIFCGITTYALHKQACLAAWCRHHALGILSMPQPDFILLNWCLMVHSRDGPESLSAPMSTAVGYLWSACGISKKRAWPHRWCLRGDDFRMWACWNEASSGRGGGAREDRPGRGLVAVSTFILLICRLPWAACLWDGFLKCPRLWPRHDHRIQ